VLATRGVAVTPEEALDLLAAIRARAVANKTASCVFQAAGDGETAEHRM
jgi:hypothetical protein